MPRCVFSREDAMFCAHVLLNFQTLNAANYSLPFMVNAVFGEVLCLLRACTMQETEYMSVFLKEVFMLLETTCTEEWLAKHPVIGQQTKHLTLVEWEKLQRKFQVTTTVAVPNIVPRSHVCWSGRVPLNPENVGLVQCLLRCIAWCLSLIHI